MASPHKEKNWDPERLGSFGRTGVGAGGLETLWDELSQDANFYLFYYFFLCVILPQNPESDVHLFPAARPEASVKM